MTSTDELVRRLNQGSRFRIQQNDRGETPSVYRVLPPPENASGQIDAYFDYQNPCLTIRKVQAREEFFDDEPGLGRLVFLLHLSGSRRIELGYGHQYELSRPTLAVFYQPLGLDKRSVWKRGANELSLSVGIWPERLTALFGFYPICLPSFSGSGGDKGEAFWYSRPLPYSLMSAAEQVLHPGIHPLLSRNYLSAKSQELLCLGLNTLLSDGEFLSRTDLAACRVEHVKTIVDANLKNPPPLSELATAFGVSAEDLSEDIRSEMGVSYVQYITERRMKRAMMMLEGRGMPLKQVAYEIGYAHTSNFCTAFKRRFGATPKDTRER